MLREKLLYQGKAKRIYATENPQEVLVEFTDQATAFDGKKKGIIHNKGELNATMSAYLFSYLESKEIPTHFIKTEGSNRFRAHHLDIIPIEVIMRNRVAGSVQKRLGKEEGFPLRPPVLEFCYKSDALGDPMINEYHIRAMQWAEDREVEIMKDMAFKINCFLLEFFRELGIELIDFKLEFGRQGAKILLADEISPDTCRFRDSKTGESLDKDRFRQDMGGIEEAYEEIVKRVKGAKK